MKRKRLVVVRWRQDRNKWEVDHANAPGAGPARSRPLFATEAEAHEHAEKMAKRLTDAGPLSADREILFRDAAAKFLAARAPDLAARTLATYRQQLQPPEDPKATSTGRLVMERLGRVKLWQLRRRQIKAVLTELKQQEYAPDSVRLVKAAISALLSWAVDEEIIDTNPALALGRAKGRRRASSPRPTASRPFGP